MFVLFIDSIFDVVVAVVVVEAVAAAFVVEVKLYLYGAITS